MLEECYCTNDNICVDNKVGLGLFCCIMIDCECELGVMVVIDFLGVMVVIDFAIEESY